MSQAENRLNKPVAVRMDDKGRLVLPLSIRKALKAEPGDTFFVQTDGDGVRIVKGPNPFDVLAEKAIKEHEAGQTKDMRELAAEWGIDLESKDE
ncbi:AbrB/MazE/SpoVT family DNA-binding domain-containing protein [Fodinisporobacter ferrooxydans]|uniref:AbrB/MazE/SpoVT family DNA-binding domain-containing protein n=1 Tax=Fodinisporobacter ferrooxydans TaxID=2901836 RepID=A0ABY4CEI4_9BACL|nr:AbrB/MazE/SpoVT family DNA-binding domain-containing protein [Alicyclobacillaceae bacterium MYW30-H2]